MGSTGSLRVLITCLLCICTSTFALVAHAIEPSPTRAERQFKDGLQLAADGQTQAAISVFKDLTRDYPALPQPYVQLAAMYARTGDLHLAISALREALRLQHDDAAIQERLGDIYVQLAERAYAAAAADPNRASAQHKQAATKALTLSNH